MSRWRKIVKRRQIADAWLLRLECGHEAYRSAKLTVGELPERVPCHACKDLIGSRIRNASGRIGVVTSYHDGLFDIAWQNDGVTHSTLDKLRETLELV